MKHVIEVIHSERWMDYLTSRISDYLRHACASTDIVIQIDSAQVVVPDLFDVNEVIQHEIDDHILEPMPSAAGNWRFRPDAYELGIEWLNELSKSTGKSLLFCLSEYSKPNDGVLESRRHFIKDSRIFLVASFDKDLPLEITKLLRQSRSNRVMAVLSDELSGPCSGLRTGIFCTDVFDGDALVICRFAAER